MNERIQELEEQCWEPKQYGPPWFNSKKFAELIVRETMLVVSNRLPSNVYLDVANSVIKHYKVD